MLAFPRAELSIRTIAEPAKAGRDVDVVQLAIGEAPSEFQQPKPDRVSVGIGEALHEVIRRRTVFGQDREHGLARVQGSGQGQVARRDEPAGAVRVASGLAGLTGSGYGTHRRLLLLRCL